MSKRVDALAVGDAPEPHEACVVAGGDERAGRIDGECAHSALKSVDYVVTDAVACIP
jgi:hypothetical protein